MKAQIIDISHWVERPINTEGTRNKSVLIHPQDGQEYYFKSSLKKERKNYLYEFWSEVIASKVGQALSFDVADYNVGLRLEDGALTVGALTPSVHNDAEELISGYNLVAQYHPQFSQTYKQEHSLQIIEQTLSFHGLDNDFPKMLECMVFDAIIGNTDRHSENWAFIANKEYLDVQQSVKRNADELPAWSENQLEFTLKRLAHTLVRYANPKFMRLAPLYDNGSSLGREIDEVRLKNMIGQPQELEGYITRGKPDIRIREQKTTFLDTIEYLCRDYPELMRSIITELGGRYDREQIEQIVSLFDQVPEMKNIPLELRLSRERKQLITTIITERTERIIKIGQQICAKQ